MSVDDAMETAAAYLSHEQEGEPLFCAEEVAITLAAEVKRLRAELALLRKDWCDDDEAIKQQALRVLDAKTVEGDSWSVPRGSALAEMMADKFLDLARECLNTDADCDRLLAELAAAKAASVCPVEMQNEQDGEQIAIKGMSHFYGDLWILKDGDEYFWLFDDYNGGNWQPITKQLYDALLDYNKRAKEADKTPPEA